MNVREVMMDHPEACTPQESCAVAGEIMRQRHCGFLPVVEDYRSRWVVGVLTDRDLALHLARSDRPASEMVVDQCMTRWPKTVSPETELQEASELMEAYGIRRLPVVDNGRLVGVLSVTDIARAARQERIHGHATIAERQLTDLVEGLAAGQA